MRKPTSKTPATGKSFKQKDSGKTIKKSTGDRDKPKGADRKPFERKEKSFKEGGQRSYDSRERRPSGTDAKKPFDHVEKRSFRRSREDDRTKPFRKSDPGKEGTERKATRKPADSRPFGSRGRGDENTERKAGRKDEKSGERKFFNRDTDSNKRKYGVPSRTADRSGKPESRRRSQEPENDVKRVSFGDFEDGNVFSNAAGNRPEKDRKKNPKKQSRPARPQTGDGLIRLNKYLSNAGVASRREADTLIQSGVVKVNGVVVDQLGYKINPGDKVTYGDAPIRSERKVYLLLNKPKDYITTTEDPQERKTVMELIAKACRERVYPVGRLDRNTTGLLLFTNDGELTTKLTHPKFGVKKVYHVSLNKGLKPDDFKAIAEGIELEDGFIKADDVAFVGEGKKEVGIEIHSGRNRIVRRIFEHLGYDVLKLDRVVFAGLTKKDLPRGKHRFLTAKEIGFLQMIG